MFSPASLGVEAPLESGSEGQKPGPKQPPAAQPPMTTSLDALQSAEQRKVLNIVDSLRQCGLDSMLSLPQLVVCGDQSSGKSSVLEAITEIPFPRKENLCTRFATEIVLRRAAISSIATKIIPDKARPKQEQQDLETFKQSITDFGELPDLIDAATKAMGIGDDASNIKHAFAKDILVIEICGPSRPQLTLVDLPGLIHAENKAQSREDVDLVAELVQKYISEPRTIILPIISAKNDYANQIILQRAREVDPDGSRTLGIITKPDDLPPGSENESSFVSLARNEDIFFSLGWHILKNRGYHERTQTFTQRDYDESKFFSQSIWRNLPEGWRGIEALRKRLSELLFRHIVKELPHLREELNGQLDGTVHGLRNLGEKRSTAGEQREYLMKLSMNFYDIAKAAVNGHYEDGFFGKTESFETAARTLLTRRLRAMVQYLNLKFADQMREQGQKYKIEGLDTSNGGNDDDGNGDDGDDISECSSASSVAATTPIDTIPPPKILTRDKALKWVEKVLVRTRGRELLGNFNPLLINELFWEQSESWQCIASSHAEDISTLCSNFVEVLLKHICPPDVLSRLLGSHIEDALKARLNTSEVELQKILADKKRYPMTFNHLYTSTIQKMRRERAVEGPKVPLDKTTKLQSPENLGGAHPRALKIDKRRFVDKYCNQVEMDMDRHSCGDALDSLHSYYDVALKTFIDNITVQVVERHIVHGLEEIFSPIVVSGWSEEEVSNLASEPTPIIRQREFLEGRLKMLKNGRTVFRSILRQSAG